MGHLVAQCFWLAAPVALTGILHMVVVATDMLPSLRVPLDGGRTWRGVPVFGPNKTWRGVVVMIAGSAVLGAAQGLFGGDWAAARDLAVVDLARLGRALGDGHAAGYALLNAVMGLGYALGELPNSFLKRRLAIAPGRTSRGVLGTVFFLVDQGDSVFMALLLGALLFGFSWQIVVVGTVSLTVLHLALNAAMYAGRLRRNL